MIQLLTIRKSSRQRSGIRSIQASSSHPQRCWRGRHVHHYIWSEGIDSADFQSVAAHNLQVSLPLGFAPTAGHKIAHPDGEVATSRAAARNGIPMCLSSWSTTRLEDVAFPDAPIPYAMQISFLKDITFTQRIIQRAEGASQSNQPGSRLGSQTV